MKSKIIFSLAMLALSVSTASAQRTSSTTVRMQDTQARLLDVTTNAYVKPLTVELQVDTNTGRIRDVWTLTNEEAIVEMDGDLANIRSWAVYKSAEKHNADVIIAATFNVRTNDDATGFEVTVVGYPGNFKNWTTATNDDLEWMRMEKVYTTNEREKVSAIMK